MKCENCGKNEVAFVYRSSVNGRVEEKHLCAECARKLGYDRYLTGGGNFFMPNMFNSGFFGNSMLDRFLSGAALPSGRDIDNPFDDFFSEMPALRSAPVRERRQNDDRLVDEQAGSEFSRQRQLNALRMELQKAVSAEEYERAAQLRDEIRQMEIQSGNTD